jgi:hypothetical protein
MASHICSPKARLAEPGSIAELDTRPVRRRTGRRVIGAGGEMQSETANGVTSHPPMLPARPRLKPCGGALGYQEPRP